MINHEHFLNFQILAHQKLKILGLLAHQGELTTELKIKILTANDQDSLLELYDSYDSHVPTKESTALKMGMDHLATILWRQEKNVIPEMDALAFFEEKSEISSPDKALALARDILTARIKDNKEAKKALRSLIKRNGTLNIEVIHHGHPELDHYKQFFPVPSMLLSEKIDHIYEILEAESKHMVVLSINIPEEESLTLLERFFIKKETACGQHVRMAVKDSYERFLLPCLEMEIRLHLLENAAIEIILPKKKPIAYWIFIPILITGLLAFNAIFHPKPDGIVKKYYPNGQIMSIEGYLNGKRDGSFRKFLPDGQIALFVTYKNGVLDGESREYYANGQWKTVKNYVDGQLEGFVQEYDQQGHLQHQVYYHNNLPVLRQMHED